MSHFAVCLKCGKKYEKNDYNLNELSSSRAHCQDSECQGRICRTDAWGYPIAEQLRKKGYPIFHCYVNTSEYGAITVFVFWGINLNKQLEPLVFDFTHGDGEDDGKERHFLFYHSPQASSNVELKRKLMLYREEIIKRIEQLSYYEDK